jgi:hypothetical protein
LSGLLLVNFSGQFVTSNLADVQGAIRASADEASWLTTGYTTSRPPPPIHEK